ncbi:MAG: glycoside hydrolase family 57 protein [Prevotellaceae bacterium]|jgi:alpha-amylase|nr:glycoside hydrolase family 57 protein [Prevotellaceae bacterium]
MKTICLYFQVHQPFRLKRYRFFDIGKDHFYYDDFSNRSILRKVAEKCYLPTNQLMLDLIKAYGKQFKIAYSLSGIVIEQMEQYAPEVIESFKKLAKTGCVEFLGETYSHSLASLQNSKEFEEQVKLQTSLIRKHFGQNPTVFRNTELIYSDSIGKRVADMGFKAMLTEGAKHVLGWRSPNFLYTNAIEPRLKILLKNFRLSDDIAFRFSDKNWHEWPLTAEKYVSWLNDTDEKDEVINLFMDYETFGEHQNKATGIFDFLRELPNKIFANGKFEFKTPGEAAESHQPVSPIHVQYPISWADEERDLSAWLGNEMQDEAYSKIYQTGEKVLKTKNENLIKTWRSLQTSDHFYYMCTKWFSDGDVHIYFNPYDTPYEAFINYMNVVSDFEILVDNASGNSKSVKKTEKPAAEKIKPKAEKTSVKKSIVATKKVVKKETTAVKRKTGKLL